MKKSSTISYHIFTSVTWNEGVCKSLVMPKCLDVGHRWEQLLKCVWRRLIGLVTIGEALLCCKFLPAQDELRMNAHLSTPSLSFDTTSNWEVICNQKISFLKKKKKTFYLEAPGLIMPTLKTIPQPTRCFSLAPNKMAMMNLFFF